MAKTGFIGLGIMGAPMACNLLRGGVDLMVGDLNPTAVAALVAQGATAGAYAEIGAQCDTVITILPSGDVVHSVLFGEGGVASTMAAGGLVCDMSSVTPAQSRRCCAMLAEKGLRFVDAPVSGGEPGAIAGTLAIMCGGEPDSFARMQPYFSLLGSNALLIGGPGAGSATKLANQVIVNLTIAAVSEALVFATRCGVDPEMVYRAIRGGLAGSAVLEAKAPMMFSRNFVPGGKISINHKDIGNVIQTAHEIDVPMPMSAQLFEILQTLKIHGHMDDDHAGIVQYFERLADTEVIAAAQKSNERE